MTKPKEPNRVRHTRPTQPKCERICSVVGDCDNCGHSVIYHAPFVGCVKCSCGEFS